VSTLTENVLVKDASFPRLAELDAALLTGGIDRPYAFGMAMSLVSKGIHLEVIGSDEIDSPEMHSTANLAFLNLMSTRRGRRGLAGKYWRILKCYARLMRYAAAAKPKVFHILWNYKLQFFDRTLLMLYYKMLGKRIAFTAHNINQGKRDGNDSLLNRITLRIQYQLLDHVFVHTPQMKKELLADFGVKDEAVTVLRHPINDAFPDTSLTPAEAKRRLGLEDTQKTILFFGRIKPYKGLEDLLVAFRQLATSDANYRLIIAGEVQKEYTEYMEEIRPMMARELEQGQILMKVQFIPDEDMEIYLKAADVLVLPYKTIFQSGVLFLSYSFGLPVIATDVGAFREEIVEGRTGFICRPNDPADMAQTLKIYFESDLYLNLSRRRQEIRDYAFEQHSWGAVAELTSKAYAAMLGRPSA
jgi:D-inositol-3-phosphate glycosyltransferase